MTDFAWTPGPGAYRHFPPYVNLTGNRLIVRGSEDLSGEHPQMGPTVSIDLPAEVLDELSAVLARKQVEEMEAHIREQITHVETRIQDGIEMGATVWRIALEDVARENRAALHRKGVEPK